MFAIVVADEEPTPHPPAGASSDDVASPGGSWRVDALSPCADPAAPTLSADPASSAGTSACMPNRSAVPVRDPDRYEVLGEHGRGGLGRISRAHDKDLGRDIAIKELLSRGHVQELRFVREAMITARLEHPGIVPVYEAGRWPDGTPFYAMKLVSGRPLRALIAERKTVDERIGLLHHVIAVADAIAYAHGRNIIHRDLKPANVIVGEFGETVVIDWGLAKDLSDAIELTVDPGTSRSPDDQLTSVGSVLGTPAYMAPEQERGESVDQRADVFAIGAMLWELCSLQKVPPTEIAQRHRLLRRAGIDRDLVVIIDKAIDPDPRARYRDAGALASDLRAFKSGARIMARSYSLPAMLMHWTRRHRALAIAAVAFLSLLLISVAALAVLYRSSSANAEMAHRNEQAARRNAATADERLVQSYVEQGRRALLEGKYHEALPFLTEAVRRGGDSPNVRFMLERAAEPVGGEVLRIQSATRRMWSATFSCDGRQLLTSDDQGAQISDAQTGRLLRALPHGALVHRALYSPGCLTLITFGKDGLVKIWDAETGALVRTLVGAAGAELSRYRAGAVSPDGRMLAAMAESPLRADVWEASTGRLLMSFASASPKPSKMAFSHDNRWFALVVGDEVRLADTRTSKVVRHIPIKDVRSLSFDPTAARLATGTLLGEVSIWAIPSGSRIHRLRDLGDSVDVIAFSPNGQLVAAGVRDGSELLWRTDSGQLHARLANHTRNIVSAEFDPTSRLWVSASSEGRVVVTDVDARRLLTAWVAPDLVWDVHFAPSSHQVVGASRDGTAHVWSINSPYLRWSSPEVDRDCGTDVTPEHDRRFLVVGCGPQTRVWDTASDTLLATLPGIDPPEPLLNWALPVISAEGDLSAIARGNLVRLYELPSGRLARTVEHAARVTTMRFSSRGHALITGAEDGTLVITPDVRTEDIRLPRLDHAVDVAALLPDGRAVAIDAERKLTIIDVEQRAHVASLISPARVAALRVSADGGRLIAIPEAGHPSPPVLWDLRHPSMVAKLEGHNRQVYSAEFVHGDDDILTAGTDGTVRLWDGRTGQPRQTLRTTRMLFDATISPDDSMVVAAGAGGQLWFWDARSGTLMWTLTGHKTYISAVHFEGKALISRAFMGISRAGSYPRHLGSVARSRASNAWCAVDHCASTRRPAAW
jgi:WD40 repeat protein